MSRLERDGRRPCYRFAKPERPLVNTQPEDRRGRTLPSLVAVSIFASCAVLLVNYAGKATLFPNMLDGVVAREWDLFALILFITSAAAAGTEILARAKLELGTPAS